MYDLTYLHYAMIKLRPCCPFSNISLIGSCILRGAPRVLAPRQDPARGCLTVLSHIGMDSMSVVLCELCVRSFFRLAVGCVAVWFSVCNIFTVAALLEWSLLSIRLRSRPTTQSRQKLWVEASRPELASGPNF